MGDKAKGPGVGDDKGGMVVAIAALRAMHKAGTLKGANIEFHMTGDEEDTGHPQAVARADLIAAGKRADVALGFEGLVRDGGDDMSSIRSEEHTSELQSLMRSSYAVFCLKKKKQTNKHNT